MRPVHANRRCASLFVSIAVILLLGACTGATTIPGHQTRTLSAENEWLVVFYMDARDSLAAEAARVLAEIAEPDTAGSGVTVVALLGLPTETRLYRIGGGARDSLVRLAADEMGLSAAGDEAPLAMDDPATLSALLSFVGRAFETQRTALVFWGAGAGYRSAAFLGAALRDHWLDLVALDTSFGACLEIAWEIHRSAAIMVASQASVPDSGWEYEQVLRRFIGSDLSAHALADALVVPCRGECAPSGHVTRSAVDLSRTAPVIVALNDFSDAVADAITNAPLRADVRAAIFHEAEGFYATPGDLSIDVADMADVVSRTFGIGVATAAALRQAVEQAVLINRTNGVHPRATGVSVHFIPLRGDGTAESGHDVMYVRRSGGGGSIAFVTDTTWVPVLPGGPGLLFRLFYEVL